MLLHIFLASSCFPLVCLSQKFSLSDLQWTLKNSNGSIAIPAQVPSQAHLDLLRARIISEPLLGANGRSTTLLFMVHVDDMLLQTLHRDGSLMRIGHIRLIWVHSNL